MNAELMKVIAGLECCSDPNGSCAECSYDWNRRGIVCMRELMRDALEILREVCADG